MTPSALDIWKAAVERGDVAAVEALFAAHPELADHVNDRIFAFDSSAIFCVRRNVELVDVLLAHGADINQKTGWGAGGFGILEDVNPEAARPLIARGAAVDIWAAVSLNDKARTIELLDADPSLVTGPGGDGRHPLHYARDVEMVDALVQRGANVNARCVDHGSTPLQYLIKSRDIVERLLEYGAEPDIYMAAYWGMTDQAERCLAADPGCCDVRLGEAPWTPDGRGDIYKWMIEHDVTPLQVARERDEPAMMEFITRHAAPLTLLDDAIWLGDRARVDALMDQHDGLLAELIAAQPAAMARAAWWFNPSALEMMFDLGFDPHVESVHQSSPLDRAAFHGYADIVEILLNRDPAPPVHNKNEFGGTPLGACLYGLNHGWPTGHPQDHVRTAELLIEAGSQVHEYMLEMGNAANRKLIREKLSG